MKRILKWAAIAVAVIAVVIGGFLAYVAISGIPTYETQKIDLVVESTPRRVEHGRQLAMELCVLCHLDATTKTLSGRQLLDIPEEFGKAYSRNITNHKTKGIGKWTDGDLAWVLRTGIQPHTGEYLPPWMPKFPHMADEDIKSIIAWLRSDDPMLQASDKDNQLAEPTFFAVFLTHVAFKPFEYPTSPKPYPDTTNTVEFGKYLATAVYDCYQCHSADFSSNNPLEPENSDGFFGGGMEMPDAGGDILRTANITSHSTNGIGRWTRQEFITSMSKGIDPDGNPFRYPMVRSHLLSDHAIGSIYDYLMTVPALDNKVERAVVKDSWESRGAELFDTQGCSSCHGKTGVGVASLMLADKRYPEDETLIDVINDGKRYNPDSFMPQYRGHISDADLAELALHVRRLCRE